MFTNNPHTTRYEITLLRHAQSVGNAGGYWQGQKDYPLSPLGEQQAHALGKYWQASGMTFDEIIASPLSRAAHTARIIAEYLAVPVSHDATWMERDNGQYSGLTGEEVRESFAQPDFLHPFEPIGITGESQWALYLRAGQALNNLMEHPPGRYLVVSHGGILNLVLYAMLGIPIQANFHGARFNFRNTAFASLAYEPERHRWLVHGINQHPHWNFEKQEPAQ
ncbi:MAG: histidine phosphatase family protein [Anaerolineales bacterium]